MLLAQRFATGEHAIVRVLAALQDFQGQQLSGHLARVGVAVRGGGVEGFILGESPEHEERRRAGFERDLIPAVDGQHVRRQLDRFGREAVLLIQPQQRLGRHDMLRIQAQNPPVQHQRFGDVLAVGLVHLLAGAGVRQQRVDVIGMAADVRADLVQRAVVVAGLQQAKTFVAAGDCRTLEVAIAHDIRRRTRHADRDHRDQEPAQSFLRSIAHLTLPSAAGRS